MTKVVAIMSMSLDGYVADAADGVAEVFDWYFSGDPTASPRSGFTFHVSAPSADHLRGSLSRGLAPRGPERCAPRCRRPHPFSVGGLTAGRWRGGGRPRLGQHGLIPQVNPNRGQARIVALVAAASGRTGAQALGSELWSRPVRSGSTGRSSTTSPPSTTRIVPVIPRCSWTSHCGEVASMRVHVCSRSGAGPAS
jgi:hypothetical protein